MLSLAAIRYESYLPFFSHCLNSAEDAVTVQTKRNTNNCEKMKSLIFKIVIPLTIVSFATFTKWWYASPVDAPDTPG